MKKFYPLVLLCAFLLVLASCGKEKSVDTIGQTPGAPTGGNGNGNGSGSGGGGSTSGSEVGTWKFVNMSAKTTAIIEMTVMGDVTKTITYSDYTTENNAGTCKFDGSNMTNTGMEYTVNTIAKGYFYTNGTLDDSIDMPFNYTLPPTNSTATYKKIGADSIYITGGTFSTPSGQTGQGSSGGYRLKWDGDKMMLTGRFSETKTQLVMGVTQKQINSAVTVITLQKQ